MYNVVKFKACPEDFCTSEVDFLGARPSTYEEKHRIIRGKYLGFDIILICRVGSCKMRSPSEAMSIFLIIVARICEDAKFNKSFDR